MEVNTLCQLAARGQGIRAPRVQFIDNTRGFVEELLIGCGGALHLGELVFQLRQLRCTLGKGLQLADRQLISASAL